MATKVLLIEDEPMLSSLYRMVLEQAAYVVDAAGDAESAEEKVVATRPHVIVLDLLIPKRRGEDEDTENVHDPMGFEILRFVKGTPGLREIRVIVLSNLDSDEHVRTAKKLGADRYFIKANLDPHDLLKEVGQVLHATASN